MSNEKETKGPASGGSTASPQEDSTSKPSRRARNDEKWDLIKQDIYRTYMKDDSTLQATMSSMTEIHGFQARYVMSNDQNLNSEQDADVTQREKMEGENEGMELRQKHFRE